MSSKSVYLKERIEELASSPAWTGQLEIQVEEENHLVLQAKSRFARDWVRDNYLPTFIEEAKALPGEEVSVRFVISPTSEEREEKGEGRKGEGRGEGYEEKEEPPRVKQLSHETLRERYSFESFVIGTSNQFAHAAARAVAQNPGQNYNPLFIYGGVGLGKTHLLNAIGWEGIRGNPRLRILYLSSENFMNELIYCLRFQQMADFRRKYRGNCDLLLVDDVQFIAGKERTQDEFFHTFNHLHDGQKQIVLTSDKAPKEIPGLEERLRSRFEWGLIADIQPPDLETRAAILKKKAAAGGFVLEDEVAWFLASHVKSNIRELEGALIRVHAFASLNKIPISIPLAKDVLGKLLSSLDRVLTVEQVQKTVAEHYKIRLPDLIGKRRVKSLALPRQIAMYLCRKHVRSSFPEIGSKFGKDHSTVVHAFSKIQNLLDQDVTLKDQVDRIEQHLG